MVLSEEQKALRSHIVFLLSAVDYADSEEERLGWMHHFLSSMDCLDVSLQDAYNLLHA